MVVYYLNQFLITMRKTKDLIFLIAGIVIFLVGVLPSWQPVWMKYVLMGAGVALVLTFYIDIIRMDPERPLKIFWIVEIVCLPIIGCLLYVIYYETAGRIQRPMHAGAH